MIVRDRLLLIPITVFLISGCTSWHAQYVPFPNQTRDIEDVRKARIYVIRNNPSLSLPSRTVRVYVYDGDKKIGVISGRHGYLCWDEHQVNQQSLHIQDCLTLIKKPRSNLLSERGPCTT